MKMAEEQKKPIILHVENNDDDNKKFLSAITEIALAKGVNPQRVASQIVRVTNFVAAKDYIKNHGENIAAVITNPAYDGEEDKGAYILTLAAKYNPRVIIGWSDHNHPRREHQLVAGISFVNFVGKHELGQATSSSDIAARLIQQPSSAPSLEAAKTNAVLILSKAIDALNISKEQDMKPSQVVDSQLHSKNSNTVLGKEV
jgi:hypothetical protein